MERYALLLSICLLSFILAGCALAQPEPDKGPYEATVRVTGEVLSTINPLLFGDNLEWTNNGMGLWNPETKAFNQAFVEEVRAAGVTHLRYPGGTLADFFEWEKTIGEGRQEIINPFADKQSGVPEYPAFGVDEFFSLCKELGCQATITLNAGTGTPEQAAAFVKYCLASGVPIASFTVGNEIYMANGEEETVLDVPIGKTPEQYVEFFRRTQELVSEFAPELKLGAIGLVNSPTFPLNKYPTWQPVVLEELAGAMAFLDVHNGYAPGLRRPFIPGQPTLSDADFAAAFLAAPKFVKENLDETLDQLGLFGKEAGAQTPVAISEYGPLIYPMDEDHLVEDLSWNRNITAALYLASLYHVLLAEPRIAWANHLPLLQGGFGALVGLDFERTPHLKLHVEQEQDKPGDFTVEPEYEWDIKLRSWRNTTFWIFQQYAGLAGRQVMKLTTSCPSYNSEPIGIVPEVRGASLLDCGAYRSQDGKQITITLLNKSLSQAASVSLEPGWESFAVHKATLFTSAGFRDENSTDMPELVIPKAFHLPATECPSGGKLHLEVPRFSLVTLELAKGLPVED